MTSTELVPENGPPAHKSPIMGTVLRWEGRALAMAPHQGGWRLRSRSKSFPVDLFFPTPSLQEAKRLAREKLAERPEQVEKPKGSLESVAQLYLVAPKRCAHDTAEGNVSRLRSVVRDAWGQTLEQASVAKLPELWSAFVAARQGTILPDYATRREANHAISSAMRQAASVFIPALRPFYSRHGISLPADAINILWPALAHKEPAKAKEDELVAAWKKLRATDLNMWLVVGLARFAGLRQSEILACRGKWIRTTGAAVYVDLKDREEDGYFHKTGRWYSALIMDPELAEYLQGIPEESSVVDGLGVDRWIQREPQEWLRQFTGSAKAPLHRLRGLYGDHVKQHTEDAILARQEAIKEASKNLGHTSVKTTVNHYLKNDGGVTSPAPSPPQPPALASPR